MKVDYISDVHLDFHFPRIDTSPKNERLLDKFLDNINIKGGDCIIVAGDVGHYNSQNIWFLKKLKSLYKEVIVVAGNHDLYLVSNNTAKKYKYSSFNRLNEFIKLCSDNDIHYLDGKTVEVDGVVFGGIIGWWDESYLETITNGNYNNDDLFKYYSYINDSRFIMNSRGKDFKIIDNTFIEITKFDPKEMFNKQINKLKSIENADVMISHFSPVVPPNMNDRYVDDPVSTFYYFNGCEEVERINPKYWVFGHTHDNYDYKYHNTNFLANAIGYPNEKIPAVRHFEI